MGTNSLIKTEKTCNDCCAFFDKEMILQNLYFKNILKIRGQIHQL